MANTQEIFNKFAKDIVQRKTDPARLCKAREWYREFAGDHAVIMSDQDLLEIYAELNGQG